MARNLPSSVQMPHAESWRTDADGKEHPAITISTIIHSHNPGTATNNMTLLKLRGREDGGTRTPCVRAREEPPRGAPAVCRALRRRVRARAQQWFKLPSCLEQGNLDRTLATILQSWKADRPVLPVFPA